jgi:transcriptional regulator
VAIHIRGELRALAAADLRPHLEALTARNEGKLAPKKPWTMDKMDPEAAERMMRMLLPVEMDLREIASTYKLGQNRGEEARNNAAGALEVSSIGQETGRLASLMREARDA